MTGDRLRLLVNELRRRKFIQGGLPLRRLGEHCALELARMIEAFIAGDEGEVLAAVC